jgi:hypothetical protein
VVLLVVIGFGWWVAAASANPGFLWYTVVDNHLLNVARRRVFPDEDVPLSAGEFLAVTGLGAFPWVLGAAVAVISLIRRRAWREREETGWIALVIWTTGLIALVTASPFRLPHYGLPAYPALALLSARAWQERQARARGLIALHLVGFVARGAVRALAAAGSGPALLDAVFSVTDVHTRKQEVLGQMTPGAGRGDFQALLAWSGLVLGLGSLGLIWLLIRGSGRSARWVVLAVTLALMPAVTRGVEIVASERSVKGMAVLIRKTVGPSEVLVHEGPIENSGALEFYSGRRPLLLDARHSVLAVGATFPDAAEVFWDVQRFRAEWGSSRRLYLLTSRPPEKSVVAFLPPDRVDLVLRLNGRALYRNGRP